jgi:outer membrane protein assembly factor BamB
MAKLKPAAEVLDLADTKLGKQLAKTFVKGVKLDAILRLLGDRVEANRLPAWITWHTGKGFDTVGHLGEPLFCATGADEDEFGDDPAGKVVLTDHGVDAYRGGDEPETVKAADPATLTSYDGGGYLLDNLIWAGTPPKAIKDARRLLATAFAAASGDLPAYEKAEPAAKSAKATKGKGAPAIVATMTATFLNGPARTSSYVGAITKKAPKLRWSAKTGFEGGGEYGGSPVVDESLGLVFTGDYAFNARVSAIRLADGKPAWKRNLAKNQSWLTGDVTVADGVLYVPCNKQVHALDARTGKPKWVANVTGVQGTPVVVGDVVIQGAGDGVFALSVDKGRKQWMFKVKRDDVKVGVRAGIAYADGVIYFIAEKKLLAIEVATQKKLWTIPADASATPSLDATCVYTWSPRGILAVDRTTGKQKWLAKLDQKGSDDNKTFAITGDRLLTRANGKLASFDLATGKAQWSVGLDTPYYIGNCGPAVGGGVAVCILIDDDTDKRALIAVDIATGKTLWKIGTMKNEPFSWYSTPSVGSDGTVFVQAYSLHALK